jgi:hypothetical protein
MTPVLATTAAPARTFVIRSLPPHDAARLRAQGGRRYVADESPGYPCRACLRDAELGQELLLVSHDPFGGPSPYRCASPIFVHAFDCTSGEVVEHVDDVPDQLSRRQLSVRAFDAEEMMTDAAVIAGSDLGDVLQRFFGDPSVERVHVHNATRGCWAATVDRR